MPNEHRCAQCGKKFYNPSSLQRHLETHMITGDWLCGLCNTLCNRISALDNHWKFACTEFKMVFRDEEIKKMSFEDLREAAFRMTLDRYAFEIDANEPGPSTTPYPNRKTSATLCVYCNLLLPWGTLNHHLGVHTKRCAIGHACQNSVVRYVCDLCGFGFRYKKSLFTHWRQKCAEIAANCPSQGVIIDNRELKKLVEELLIRAEVVTPVIVNNIGEDESEYDNRIEEVEEIDDDEETKPSYTSPIIPSLDRQIWNIKDNKLECVECPQCNRMFHSTARLMKHTDSFHEVKKYVHCELCQMKFSQKRALTAHYRGPCKAMQVEEPDTAKLKRMPKEELEQVINEAKERWKTLFDNKKTENIKFITEFLDSIDRKNPQLLRKIDDIVLDVPMQVTGYVRETESDIHFCEFCKIKFNSSRFLYQHHQLVHSNQQSELSQSTSRNQLTITASSLLPYFKLPDATFYTFNGKKYRLGKYLEKGKELVKHLKYRIVEPGSKVEKVEKNDNFVVKLVGKEEQYVLLNEHEFPEVCNRDGTLNCLYDVNPKLFDDIPVLSREV